MTTDNKALQEAIDYLTDRTGIGATLAGARTYEMVDRVLGAARSTLAQPAAPDRAEVAQVGFTIFTSSKSASVCHCETCPDCQAHAAIDWLKKYFNGQIETGTDSDASLMVETIRAALSSDVPKQGVVEARLENFPSGNKTQFLGQNCPNFTERENQSRADVMGITQEVYAVLGADNLSSRETRAIALTVKHLAATGRIGGAQG